MTPGESRDSAARVDGAAGKNDTAGDGGKANETDKPRKKKKLSELTKDDWSRIENEDEVGRSAVTYIMRGNAI